MIANSSRIGTIAPIDMPFSTFMDSGYEVSRADEVRGQQILQLFGRDASPFEVPVVEADGGLDEVRELLADVDPAVEPVALRPHDPDVPHARIMGEPRRAR